MMLIEKHIVEDLIGASAAFCFGHHFSSPLLRAAFQTALAEVTQTHGTMLYGNTVAYQRDVAANYASLSSYLMADICALMTRHSGHAINPVPVTENLRIPDADEILDAQIFAARLVEHAPAYARLLDHDQIDGLARQIRDGGGRFAQAALRGLGERGVDVADPAALMLAIRRMGAKRMEALFGQGPEQAGRRHPLVFADWAEELEEMAASWLATPHVRDAALTGLRVALGTTDVHEHGAYLVTRALEGLGADVREAGVAVDAEDLVQRACAADADVIAISTYNGVALTYTKSVFAELERLGREIPVVIGGKLNQIPEASNSDLPVDVSDDIRALGAAACGDLDDMLAALAIVDR